MIGTRRTINAILMNITTNETTLYVSVQISAIWAEFHIHLA